MPQCSSVTCDHCNPPPPVPAPPPEVDSKAKLYIVLDGELPPGVMLAQAVHAAREFQKEHPELEQAWHEKSNHVAILSAKDATELDRLCDRAFDAGIPYSRFYESDLGPPGSYALTAVAFGPGPATRRLCRSYPLALSA